MGQVIAMANCPWHDDRNPSLAIYENGYYCFGCHKKGTLLPWMTEIVHGVDHRVTKKLPRVDELQYEFVYSEDIVQFFDDRQIDIEQARDYGIRAKSNSILIPCYDMDTDLIGYQKRDVTGDSKNKYITIPYNDVYPEYSFSANGETLSRLDNVVLVESVIDALYINDVGYKAIALLGTTLRSKELLYLLANMGTACVALFDPDANVIASYLCDKLDAHGIPVSNIVTNKKPYEYDKREMRDKLSIIYELRR